ncbi:MAG: glycosyltransferase [Anaerolineae bacterium]|nr:glycosyltransferase [Anaerolineae bacterium]
MIAEKRVASSPPNASIEFPAPIVSVIIPAYNAEQSLGDQLEAIYRQDFDGDLEVIVIDNGSTDNTASVVRYYQQKMAYLKLVQAPERRNRSYARNEGVKRSRGSLLLFCDADDVVREDWVKVMSNALKEHTLVICPAETRLLRDSTENEIHLNGTSLKEIYLDFLPVAMGCNSGVRRHLFEEAGGFSENFPRNQDVDFSWRLQLMGHDIHLTRDTVIYYRPRNTYKGVIKQGFEVGMAQVNLYRTFSPLGMPKSSLKKSLVKFRQIIRGFKKLHRMNRKKREQWLQNTATQLGRIVGSFRYKRFYI